GIMTSHRGSLFIVILGLLMCPVAWIGVWSQTSGITGVPLATQDSIRNPGWWPTKGSAARSEYRGSVACKDCHAMKAAPQPDPPMAGAAPPAGSASLLRKHDLLMFHSGTYEFQISAGGDGPVYSVSDGRNSLQQVLAWAFGTGEVGQTYV